MTASAEQSKHHILVIDDSKVVRWQASKLLEKDYQVHLAEDGRQAWDILQENRQITMAFCDIQMPEMNGYELLEQVRTSGNLRLVHLPIVMVTGDADDQEVKHRCLDAGATDFIPKPFDDVIMKGRAAAYTGYHSRLSKLESQVEQDKLTGLASVQYFRRFGEQGLALALRHQTDMTLVLAELDNQDELIARLGKKVFAQVLTRIGKQLTDQLREEDLVSRVGLARYGVILPLTNRLGAAHAVDRIHQSVKSLRLKFAGQLLELSFSVGVTSLNLEQKSSFVELVKSAESALNQAKGEGGDAIAVFGQQPGDVEAAEQQAADEPEPVEGAVVSGVIAETPEASVAVAATPEPVGDDPASMPAPEAEPVAAKQPAPAVDIPPLRELDLVMLQAKGEGLEVSTLRGVMRRLWPLLEYADNRLGLGLRDALDQARQRLDSE